jgi:molybdenum storage protein
LLAECFGSQDFTFIKDVDGLYTRDPKQYTNAELIPEISVNELRRRDLETLPFDRVLLDLLDHARLLKRFQIVNGRQPDRIIRALSGDHVGTIVDADAEAASDP